MSERELDNEVTKTERAELAGGAVGVWLGPTYDVM